jgi:hypothetical protein
MRVPSAQHEVEAEVTKGDALHLMAAKGRAAPIGLRHAITETPGVRMAVQPQDLAHTSILEWASSRSPSPAARRRATKERRVLRSALMVLVGRMLPGPIAMLGLP